ncbi:hypothetical protein PPTG_24556 [Phytophthora nicotianae INRA-310]|uniref:Uncharacterized protein n=1 Tax=Phytophthora nicotianae (strain INRA-310) TaxID=761204 RepID=W2PFD5_PHYN3|nr:hypothetical protein PPTG_24556 [Phytophthora nicotianae INRA-310]ETM98724.1 hypothetical protein PPTG_24556 [Phytophthora nicotianae INRA-310]
METPPRGRKAPTPASSKKLHARLKRQMEGEMDVEGNPEMERMGDENLKQRINVNGDELENGHAD